MSKSNLAAVTARRAEIPRELAENEKRCAVLRAELAELELTERVLARLQALYSPPVLPPPIPRSPNVEPVPQPLHGSTALNTLQDLAEKGLHFGRDSYDKIRAEIERRVEEARKRTQ